ncbi:MAG: type II secretion system F family protein [Candidatus Dormibacteria bacterium]
MTRAGLLAVGAVGTSACWLALTVFSYHDARNWLSRLGRRLTWAQKQGVALRQAGLGSIRTWWWVGLRVAGPLLAGAAALAFFRIPILGLLAALAIHHLMGLVLELRRRGAVAHRQAALLDALRYGAAMMARAGNALQMVNSLADTGPFEARRVFSELAVMTVGESAMPLSAAAQVQRERLADPLFDDFAMALKLHSEHGGKLVPALDALVGEWEETLRLQREAKAMRAGIEASVLLLSLLPFVFLLILQSLAPGLLLPFRSVAGEILLGLAVAWMVLGYRVLQSMSAPPREERLTLAEAQ